MLFAKRLSGQEIRLLAILPAESPDQPLKCQLRETTLEKAPSYEALSYVWGNPNARAEVQCDGESFSATLNLHRALTRLRFPDAARVLWVDAICINQEDLSERAHQVTLMGQIYIQAKRVVVWLGHEVQEQASAAKTSMEIIRNACMELEKRWLAVPGDKASIEAIYNACTESGKEWLDEYGGHDRGELPYKGTLAGFHLYRCVDLPRATYDGLAWKSLKLLYDRPWFQRTWCVQEVRLSQSAICFWGTQELPWSLVGTTAAWLNDLHGRHDFAPGVFPEEIEYSPAFHMYDTEWEKTTLLDTLKGYRELQATDPRDKVYGLLNLVEAGNESDAIIVDYARPVKEVYANAALQIIRSSSSLDILAYVKHPPEYTGEDGFHSWAPRWDIVDRAMALTNFGIGPTWSTWDGEPMEGVDKLSVRSGYLRVLGLPFSRVTSIGIMLDDVMMKDPEKIEGTHPFLDRWNEVLAEHKVGSTEGILAMMGMALTLTAGLSEGTSLVQQMDPDPEQVTHYSNYLAMIDHLFRVTGQANSTSFEPLDMAYYDGDRTKFEEIAWKVCDQRRLFMLESGACGLGPACMREGDLAVILSGGDIPYILREKEGAYCFIGEAYINSIIAGELIEDLRSGKIELQEYFIN